MGLLVNSPFHGHTLEEEIFNIKEKTMKTFRSILLIFLGVGLVSLSVLSAFAEEAQPSRGKTKPWYWWLNKKEAVGASLNGTSLQDRESPKERTGEESDTETIPLLNPIAIKQGTRPASSSIGRDTGSSSTDFLGTEPPPFPPLPTEPFSPDPDVPMVPTGSPGIDDNSPSDAPNGCYFFDADLDGDVDPDDLEKFNACTSNPASSGCQRFDYDEDGDIDQTDRTVFEPCQSQPNQTHPGFSKSTYDALHILKLIQKSAIGSFAADPLAPTETEKSAIQNFLDYVVPLDDVMMVRSEILTSVLEALLNDKPHFKSKVNQIIRTIQSGSSKEPFKGRQNYYYVFAVSVRSGPADLGGLAGVDHYCQISAEQAGLNGNYKAWLSTNEANAGKRFYHSEVPYRLPSGEVVAYDWNDLTDGTLRYPIMQSWNADGGENEYFRNATLDVLTGTDIHGLYAANDVVNNCAEWTASQSQGKQFRVFTGSSNSSDFGWTRSASPLCRTFSKSSFYCFEQFIPEEPSPAHV